MTSHDQFISLDTTPKVAQFSYTQYGALNSSGIPLVFLHGINSGAASWRYQHTIFESSNDHDNHNHHNLMIHWNMPGYGHSDCYLDAPLAHDYAVLLHQLVTQLGIKKFILVGHSLGALIAYAYSKQYGDSLKGIFLASCTRGYGDQTNEVKENIANLRPNLYQQKGQQAYIDANLSRLAHSVTGEKYEIIKQVISNIGFLGIKGSSHLLAYSRIDAYKHLVNVPFHMVCGEDDKITEFEDVKRLSQELGAQFTPIPNAGHPCYLENEQAFNQALLHFIKQVNFIK